MTHDYKRHGTTTLFAALNVLTGIVISQCMPRHRHQEWLTFLKTIDRAGAPRTWRSTSSWTTTPPTNTKTSAPGWTSILGSTCTSPRHRRPGSTWWNAGSAS